MSGVRCGRMDRVIIYAYVCVREREEENNNHSPYSSFTAVSPDVLAVTEKLKQAQR